MARLLDYTLPSRQEVNCGWLTKCHIVVFSIIRKVLRMIIDMKFIGEYYKPGEIRNF